MRKRVNTLNWSKAEMLMRKLCSVQLALMYRHKEIYPCDRMHEPTLAGDSYVMVELIGLRDQINEILAKSKAAGN